MSGRCRIDAIIGGLVAMASAHYRRPEFGKLRHLAIDYPASKITLLEVHPEHLPKRLVIHKPIKIDGKIV
jgi:hypothetical protein